jgi:hypothetical protein
MWFDLQNLSVKYSLDNEASSVDDVSTTSVLKYA